MLKHALFSTLLGILLFYPQEASAQYAFDVKTQLAEKHDLQVAKQGVLAVFEEASWISVAEVGEDYSVWLTDLQRYHRNDSLYAVIDVHLRSPAMLTNGRYIDSRTV